MLNQIVCDLERELRRVACRNGCDYRQRRKPVISDGAYYGDWSVFADGSACWVASAPMLSTDNAPGSKSERRSSSARLMVIYRVDGTLSEVSFVGVYIFEAGVEVYAEFGSEAIDFFFADGEGAWPEGAGAEERMQQEMTKGTQVVFHVHSPDGFETVNVFSPIGFKASVEDAANRCGQ